MPGTVLPLSFWSMAYHFVPAHVKSSLLGCSLSIPITNGALNLGTWQARFYFLRPVKLISLTFRHIFLVSKLLGDLLVRA
jgi:hypothetical protein